jgi:diguanylate cyclase (GGDEF)-like protein
MQLNTTTEYPVFKEVQQPAWMERLGTQVASASEAFRLGLVWLFDLGIQPEMPFYLKNNLGLINRVTFFSLLLSLPGSFVLMLMGFDHPLTLLVVSVLVLCSILGLNAARQVQWAQALFAFAPAATLMTYLLVELSSGDLTGNLLYILARQGVCLSLLLPIFIYGFEKSQRWVTLGECVIVFLAFDIASLRTGSLLFAGAPPLVRSFFSLLSVLQLAGLSACVLYMQGYTVRHDLQVAKTAEKLQSMAIHDGLTGIYNRGFMEQVVGDAINRARRSNTPLSLLMVDVDYFKQVNDTLGHNVGDAVLKRLVKLIETSKRSTDYLGRWGGDELLLVLNDTGLEGARLLADKLRQRIDGHVFPSNVHLTVSLGASAYQDGDSLPTFIGRSDEAMYRAKQLGRNRVAVQS